MKCYACGKPILHESQRVMEEVRMFRWSDTPVLFHKEYWAKRKFSARKQYAETFVESLILLAVALIAVYVVV